MLTADKKQQSTLSPIPELRVGLLFRHKFRKYSNPYYYEIREIDRESGRLIIKVTNPDNDDVWEEDWTGDIKILENAFEIGEYVLS